MEKEVILVIDDELGPRESVRMMFKDTYKVITADSGEKCHPLINKPPKINFTSQYESCLYL